MSDDEIKLIVSLAEDPGYEPGDSTTDTMAVRDWLNRMHALRLDGDGYLENTCWLHLSDTVGFLREVCLWDDRAPNTKVMQSWLAILSQDNVKLCDLTPQAWGRILETETIKRLNQ